MYGFKHFRSCLPQNFRLSSQFNECFVQLDGNLDYPPTLFEEWKNGPWLGCLGYIGDYTTQSRGDDNPY